MRLSSQQTSATATVRHSRAPRVIVKADYNVISIKKNHGEASRPPGYPQDCSHSSTRMKNQSIETKANVNTSPQCSPAPPRRRRTPRCLFSAALTPIDAPPSDNYECSGWIGIGFHRGSIHPIETLYTLAFYTSMVLFIWYVFRLSHVRSYTELKETYILTKGTLNTIDPIFTYLNDDRLTSVLNLVRESMSVLPFLELILERWERVAPSVLLF